MTTLLVINPYSRDGDTDCDAVKATLAECSELHTHRLDSDRPLAATIDTLGTSLERIVVAGGDGTLNSTLADVLSANVPLGVLPMGTANDFARSLSLPTDPEDAARVIRDGHTREVDIGVVNDRYFLNAVGIGLGPELTKEMDQEKKKRLGVLAYLESLVQVLGSRRRRYAHVTVDDEHHRLRFMQITIANGRHYGGGMMVTDEARLDDARLHVLCLRPLSPWQLFLRGLRFRFGKLADDEKTVYCCGREVVVETGRPCDVTADGELITRTPIRCQVRPKSLSVYVPQCESQERTGDTSAQGNSELRAVAG